MSESSRSPEYPYIDLGEAIERTKLIFNKEKTHFAHKEVVATALGYQGLNGASNRMISALGKYGLLDETNNQYRVSDSALSIIKNTTGHPERVHTIRAVALKPSVFNDLYTRYGFNLPSDHNIKSYLTLKGFNETAAERVVVIFRNTMELLEEEEARLLTLEKDAHYHGVEESQSIKQAKALTEDGSSTTVSTNVASQSRQTPNNEKWGDKELKFQISPNCEARVEFRGEVTQEAIEKLSKFLELSKDSFPSAKSLVEKSINLFPSGEV
jgi:hypothetical protein